MKGKKTKKPLKKTVKKKTVKPSPVKTKKVKPVKIKKVKKVKKIKIVDESIIKSKIMTCVVTGLERRVSKAGVAKGNKKFGGPVSFSEHYVSNEAKRLLRQRISPEEVQKQLRPANKKPFSIDHQVLARLKLLKKPKNNKRMSLEEVQQISIKWVPKEPRTYSNLAEYVTENTKNGSCIAPQLYLDSDRVCDHCKYTKHCLSTAKTFSKKYKG
jgi:hypothetical protein